MKLHIVMHESFEAPGAIVVWAEKNNFSITYTRLYKGDVFPQTCDEFDYLIVMGGPQSPATTITECPHFDARKEITFIKKAIDANKYVLGICLGAQLIGEALGARYDHSPEREIGVFPLTLTEMADQDLVFSKFPKEFPVGHWHGDMPGVTKDTAILAYSDGCPRQIVRYTSKVYGFQCHFEFTKESVEGMIKNCGEELKKYATSRYVETPALLLTHDYTTINEYLFRFLDFMEYLFQHEVHT